VTFDRSQITSRDWETYPIFGFAEAPEIEIKLVGDTKNPPLGVGEVSAGPAAACVANAVSRALGVRVRDLPLTRDRIMSAMMA
jgi:nicotinate dehydrogenase subunit B